MKRAAASAPALVLPTLRRRSAAQPLKAEPSPCMDAFVVRDCLSAAECAAVVAAAAPCLKTATSRGPRHGEAHRRHGRAECSSRDFAAQLWERLQPALAEALPAACGLSPSLRFYAYSAAVGDVFGPHYDQSCSLRDAAGRALATLYTVLFYVSAPGVAGGETIFYVGGDERRELCRVPPAPGSVLVFRQGAGGLLHSSGPVRAGTKWVMRTDLAFAA
jgi:hypothetical protein